MVTTRAFTVRRENNESFTIISIFASYEIKRILTEYEQELGPHKTLNIIPEFPFKHSFPNAPITSYCQNGMVIALHCVATF